MCPAKVISEPPLWRPVRAKHYSTVGVSASVSAWRMGKQEQESERAQIWFDSHGFCCATHFVWM
jgi:hypothetical protein